MNENDLIEKYTKYLRERNGRKIEVASQIKLDKGVAIADLLVNYKSPQCIEIKSDSDSLRRLKTQLPVYTRTFKKTYILCGEKLLQKAINETPDFVGVMTIESNSLVYHRAAVNSPNFNYYEILESLWKDELITLALEFKVRILKSNMTKEELRNALKSVTRKQALNARSISLMFNRFKKLDKML